MTKLRQYRALLLAALSAALLAVWLETSDVHAGSCCDSGSAATSHDDHRQHSQTHRHSEAEPPFRAPHGGQLSRTIWYYFEVVYGAQEARVYLYDMFRTPASLRAAQGHVFMRVRSNGGQYHYPLQYVPVEDGHDYLVARVDLTHVRDRDMDVYFDLSGLPNADAPTARIANVFMRPTVGGASHIVAKTSPTSQQFLSPVPTNTQHHVPQVLVTESTVADDAAILAQGICPVMNQPLGSHGRPTKIVIDGQALFVCCTGCVNKVKSSPELYLARVYR